VAGKKGRTGTNPNSHKSGAANLKKHTDKYGHKAPLKHGIHSPSIRLKFSARRTNEGKWLCDTEQSIIDHLGGPEALNPFQQVIMGGLRSKLITVYLIGQYIDKRSDVIDSSGDLIPVMRKSFLQYSASITTDLEKLWSFGQDTRRGRVPTIEDIIDGHN